VHVANTDGSEIVATSIVYDSLDTCGHYLVELSRRERGFDSRWDHQTNQIILLPAPLDLGKYSTARLDTSY
jgi:hypothetical protein